MTNMILVREDEMFQTVKEIVLIGDEDVAIPFLRLFDLKNLPARSRGLSGGTTSKYSGRGAQLYLGMVGLLSMTSPGMRLQRLVKKKFKQFLDDLAHDTRILDFAKQFQMDGHHGFNRLKIVDPKNVDSIEHMIVKYFER